MLDKSFNGLQSKSWGPAFWMTLYSVAANYASGSAGLTPTIKDRYNAMKFLEYFGKSLPCAKCRKSFKKNRMRANSYFDHDYNKVFSTRDNFFRFVYILHDSVTLMVCHKSLPFTLGDAEHTFNNIRAGECNDTHGCYSGRDKASFRLHLQLIEF